MTEPIPASAASAALSERASLWYRFPAWRLVALVAIVLYLPWGGDRSLWFPDEPDVAEPAMTMVETGDWVVPRRNDEPWLDYPPMTYWLGATSARLLGGASPLALRLPIALLAVLFVCSTAVVVERLAGRVTGLWAGIAMATAPQFAYQALNFHPDMAFAIFISAGIATYAWGTERHHGWRSGALRCLGFACFGAAVLSKGPLGLLLPGLILVIWHLSRRQLKAILWMAPLTLVAAAVAAPWYLLLAGATSAEFVGREIYLQNFARFGGGARGHAHPWPYYLTRIWVDWGPWSLLLPAAVVTGFRRDWKRPGFRLALLWFLVTFLFLTVATTKRQVYLLPAYPAIAFLIGRQATLLLDRVHRPWTAWALRVVGVVSLLGAGVLAAALLGATFGLEGQKLELARHTTETIGLPLALLATILTGGGLFVLWSARRGIRTPVLAGGGALLVGTYLVILVGAVPFLDAQRSYRPAAVYLRQQAGPRPIGYYLPGARLKMAGFRVHDPKFLALDPLETPREVADYLAQPGRLLVVLREHVDEIAPLVPEWDSLPRRDLFLSRKEFVAIGPRRAEPAR